MSLASDRSRSLRGAGGHGPRRRLHAGPRTGSRTMGPALLVLSVLVTACGAMAEQWGGTGEAQPGPPGTPPAAAPDRPRTAAPLAAGGAFGTGNVAPASASPGPNGHRPAGSPAPTFQPLPRAPLSVALGVDPGAWFAHQQTKTWCAPSAVQMALAALGLADTSAAFQAGLQARVGLWTSRADSRNGGWGPEAMARALSASGATGYEVRAFPTREAALRDGARAIMETASPVILLAWRGAHAWVMTGFRATADPSRFPDAEVAGAFILDPWYPWVSTIWGASDPPGTFQDAAEMRRNFLPWKRPEGRYPGRDGQFVTVVPTLPRSSDE